MIKNPPPPTVLSMHVYTMKTIRRSGILNNRYLGQKYHLKECHMVITYPIPMWGDSSRVGAHKILMVVQTARMVVQYDVSWRVMV